MAHPSLLPPNPLDTRDGVSPDIFSEIQTLVQRLSELERNLQGLLHGQVDAIIDPNSGDIILLRQAQQALHSNERQLRALFEAALDAIVITDDDGFYLDGNPAACDLFGIERQELIGKHVSEFTPPIVNADGTRQAASHKTPLQRGSFRLLRADGSIRETEFSTSANFLPGRHLSVLRDVTERYQSETALRRSYDEVQAALSRSNALYAVAQHLISTENLPRLLEAVVEGVEAVLPANWVSLYILDMDKRQILERRARGNFDGITVTLSFAELMEGLSGEVIRTGMGLISPKGSIDRREGEDLRKKRAQLGAGSIMVAPLLYQDRVLGTLTAINPLDAPDFTQDDLAVLSAMANQASVAIANAHFFHRIQEQADQLQRVMDSVPDGLILLDPQHHILLANPSARTMLAHCGRVSSDERLLAFMDVPIETLLSASASSHLAHVVEKTPPEPAIFEVTSHSMGTGDQGDGWLLVLHDVTAERENQQRAMQQGQLAAVGQLAAGIAHDFNNIMGAIVIYSQLLKNTLNLVGKDRERLAVIHQQAQYAAELVRQLLDFSRSSILERRPLNLVPFCKDVVTLLERILPETIETSFTSSRQVYRVNVDPARFQQALINMAVNARDAMPRGGVLRLSLTDLYLSPQAKPPLPEMKPGSWLSIEISDNGSGIPGNVLGHIFDPFFSTKDRGKGSGLGLAQVHGIVQQHDGHIKVESTVNQGTTFVIYLPLLETEEDVARTMTTAPMEQSRHRCILVVEDNVATRDALVDFLDINGYRVMVAKDGQDALQLFKEKQQEIDLVLSDMIMPRLGGMELFHALRAIKPDVKMILMTGYPLQEDGRQLLEKGGITWLQKPFEVETLISMMQKLW